MMSRMVSMYPQTGRAHDPKAHRLLLKKASDSLSRRDLTIIKFLCTDVISPSKLEKIKDGIGIWTQLEDQRLINVGNYDFVLELLYHVDKLKVIREVFGEDSSKVKELLQLGQSMLSRYRLLLLRLGLDIPPSEVHEIKYMFHDDLSRSESEAAKDIWSLFLLLEDHNLLSEDNVNCLELMINEHPKMSDEANNYIESYKFSKDKKNLEENNYEASVAYRDPEGNVPSEASTIDDLSLDLRSMGGQVSGSSQQSNEGSASLTRTPTQCSDNDMINSRPTIVPSGSTMPENENLYVGSKHLAQQAADTNSNGQQPSVQLPQASTNPDPQDSNVPLYGQPGKVTFSNHAQQPREFDNTQESIHSDTIHADLSKLGKPSTKLPPTSVAPNDMAPNDTQCHMEGGIYTGTRHRVPKDHIPEGAPVSLQELPSYNMGNRPYRGFCFIINNWKFTQVPGDKKSKKLEDRPGSEVDADKLEKLFTTVGFEVRRYENCSSHKMANIFSCLINDPTLEKDNGVVVCVLSHGKYGSIYDCNGYEFKISDMLKYFKPTNCKAMANKPKMFFIQACQGKDKQKAVKLHTDGPVSLADEMPTDADFFIGYATVPGYVSYRHEDDGSWYINALYECFRKYSHKFDVLSMMTEVSHGVSRQSAPDGDLNYKQMPLPYSTLRMKIFLTPVKPWD